MEKEAANRLASIGGPVGRRYRPKRMFWKSLESFVTKAILVSMCVLNFESCALVRQRTKQESQTQEMSLTQRRLTAIALSDSLASRLNIIFDSVEIVVDDSPSPQVKVKATKATINSETNHTVTGRELAASTDTLSVESRVEKVDDRIAEPSKKPPWWVWVAGTIALSIGSIIFCRFMKYR